MECITGLEPTTSSARISEDSPGDLPSRQRYQSQSMQQVKPLCAWTQKMSDWSTRVFDSHPPQSTQVNDFGSEDVSESGTRSSFPQAFEVAATTRSQGQRSQIRSQGYLQTCAARRHWSRMHREEKSDLMREFKELQPR
jgi:hypothetical protein